MYESRCKLCGKRLVADYKCNIRTFCNQEHFHTWLRLPQRERTAECKDKSQTSLRDMTDDGFIALIAAIVDRASTDILLYSSDSHHRCTAEQFFLSDYFGALTGLDGKPILQALLAERREKTRKKNRGRK